jgi:Fe-S cluster assembly protein SufD
LLQGIQESLTERSIRELSWQRGEPEWLLERRLEAWHAFERLPLPGPPDELWRCTDLSSVSLGPLSLGPATPQPSPPEGFPEGLLASLAIRGKRAGIALQMDFDGVFSELSQELAERGVIFTSLGRAVRDWPELLRERLMVDCIRPEENKFAALHGALWSGGVLLYVPQGVRVELPFHAIFYLLAPGLALLPHTLVILERGSGATLLEERLSPPLEGEAFASPMVEVFIGEGAQFRYIGLEGWGEQVVSVAAQRSILQREASLETFSAHLGGGLSKAHTEAILKGPGARSDILGLTFGNGGQHFDQYTLQDHQAPHTQSDLLYKAVVRGQSRYIYYGLIHIDREAQRSDAFQTSRNLLLGEEARADAIPVLEIEADDVRCSHAAAVGPVDREQLFYLMTRGLPQEEATRVLVGAFFEPLIERLPIGWLREKLKEQVRRKIG